MDKLEENIIRIIRKCEEGNCNHRKHIRDELIDEIISIVRSNATNKELYCKYIGSGWRNGNNKIIKLLEELKQK